MFVTSVVRLSPSIVLLCLICWDVLQVRKRFDVQGGPFVAGMTGFFCLRFSANGVVKQMSLCYCFVYVVSLLVSLKACLAWIHQRQEQ